MKRFLKSKGFLVFVGLFAIGFVFGAITGNAGFSFVFGQLAGYWLLLCLVIWLFKKAFIRSREVNKNNSKSIMEVVDVKKPAH